MGRNSGVAGIICRQPIYWGNLAEGNSSGTITSEYIFVNGERVARRDAATGNVYYYLTDLLGNSNVVTDSSGHIQNESDFYPFGGERVITQALTNQKFKFTGKERDAETGNDYFGARYYSSFTGRFMSPDWAAKADSIPYARLNNPQSLNLYSYAQGNAETLADHDGHLVTPWDAWRGHWGSSSGQELETQLDGSMMPAMNFDLTTAQGEYSSSFQDQIQNDKTKDAQQNGAAAPDKKSKIPAQAVIGPHTPDPNGASNYYTYYLENAAGKRLKGKGYATEEHIKFIDTIGNVNLGSQTSEGTFVPSPKGAITDRVGLTAPLPTQYLYFSLATQTFTVSYKGQNYDLSTEFIHITAASGGKVTTAAVGVVVP